MMEHGVTRRRHHYRVEHHRSRIAGRQRRPRTSHVLMPRRVGRHGGMSGRDNIASFQASQETGFRATDPHRGAVQVRCAADHNGLHRKDRPKRRIVARIGRQGLELMSFDGDHDTHDRLSA